MDAQAIAAALEAYALLLELAGENAFKAHAYRRGAGAVAALDDAELARRVADGTLTELPGIGAGLSGAIAELARWGRSQELEALRAATPPGLIAMTRIAGLGPKRVRAIHQALGLTTLGELEYACQENRLARLKGFGEKSQAKILKGLRFLAQGRGQILLLEALARIEALRDQIPDAQAVGDARRGAIVVRRIEVLTTAGPERAIDVGGGREIVVHVASPADWGNRLLALTGPPDFAAAVAARLPGGACYAAEGKLFAAAGLPWIEPCRRHQPGVIVAAAAGTLTPLLDETDIRGVFHLHTTFSDGRHDLEAMVAEAARRGYEYIGISDHSQSAIYAHGLKAEDLRRQRGLIDELRPRYPGLTILHGVESDILADGALDYGNDVLAALDFVIGSVHGHFELSRADQTRRLLCALDHPLLTMLGHPTGRLLLAREGLDCDMDAVLERAARRGVFIELNAHPRRLDLDPAHHARARELGAQIVINPDAHATEGYDALRWGLAAARYGGLAAADVFNSRPADKVVPHLRARRGERG